MKLTKMQGIGNDYLYFFSEVPENVTELAVRLSDRHFGVGSDGLIYISPSKTADFRMRIFNADGSEAKMCGNGIRCVGKYVYEKGYTEKTELTVETLSGIKHLKLHLEDGIVTAVSVNMGTAEVSDSCSVDIDGRSYTLTPVSTGNPHAVMFVEEEGLTLPETIGRKIEHHALFPGGVNAEFIRVKDANRLRMRVWERGSGVTMACGTGACASTAAAVHAGYCRAGQPVTVELDGGTLEITVQEDGTVWMKGPAEFVYEAEVTMTGGTTVCPQ